MSNRFTFRVGKNVNKVLDFAIFVGGNRYPVIKEVALEKSGLIRKLYTDQSEPIKIDYDNPKNDFQCIANLFCCAVLTFNNRNIDYILDASQFFEIPELFEAAQNFKKLQSILDDVLNKPNELSSLMQLENKILNLTESNYDDVILFINDFVKSKYDVRIISRLIYKICFARSSNIPLLVKLASESKDVLKRFLKLVLKEFNDKKEITLPNEINFILFYLIEFGINSEEILASITPKANSMTFWSHLTNKEGSKEHIEKIKKGENPDPIPNAIRHDDSDTLQKLIIASNFNVNGRATSSVYEICSFMNKKSTLVEYAAFFGAVKCYKYLMLNGAKYPRYVFEIGIAGGNSEIIHLIEQNESFFLSNNSAYNAILFHRLDIFEWLVSNHPEAIGNYESFLGRCIDESAFSIIELMLREGADPNGLPTNPALFSAINNDNLRLVDFLLQLENVNTSISDRNGNTVLHTACLGQKTEIIRFLLKNPRINKNSKNIFFFNFLIKFLLIDFITI